VLFLRNDAQITVSELTSTVNDSFLLKYDFNKYNQDIQEKKKKKKKKKRKKKKKKKNNNIINQLSNLI